MRVAGCLNAHGIGGYNLLTQLLRPYPELRGFYFGVRSELYRLCEPKDSSTTSYIHLKEIQTKRDTNSLSIYYKPLKPALLIEGRYTADLRNGLLQPVLNPQKDGPNKLVGFFSKNEFSNYRRFSLQQKNSRWAVSSRVQRRDNARFDYQKHSTKRLPSCYLRTWHYRKYSKGSSRIYHFQFQVALTILYERFLKKVVRKTFLKWFFATANFYQIAS
jgi:hypothetical protein